MNIENVQLKATQGAFSPITIIHTDVPAWETCVYVVRSHHCVYPTVYLTRHTCHLDPVCRNVYDTLLNITMAWFVSMN